MTEKIISPATDEQAEQILGFFKAVLKAENPNKDEFQRLLGFGDVLQGKVREFIQNYRQPYFAIDNTIFPVEVDYGRKWQELRERYSRVPKDSKEKDIHGWDYDIFSQSRKAPLSGSLKVPCRAVKVGPRVRTFKQLVHLLRAEGYKLADIWTLLSFGEQYFETELARCGKFLFLHGELVGYTSWGGIYNRTHPIKKRQGLVTIYRNPNQWFHEPAKPFLEVSARDAGDRNVFLQDHAIGAGWGDLLICPIETPVGSWFSFQYFHNKNRRCLAKKFSL